MNAIPIPQGTWTIRYNHEHFSYRQALAATLHADRWIRRYHPEHRSIELRLDKDAGSSGWNDSGSALRLLFTEKEPAAIVPIPGIAPVKPHLPAIPIRDILLCSPFQPGDIRWNTIELTGAALFIGSALTTAGYNVTAAKQPLPALTVESRFENYQLLGFTLFEETIESFKDFIKKIPPAPERIMAGGGPLVSLNPLHAAFHLQELNLLARGEAELALPPILDALGRGNVEDLLRHEGLLFQIPGLILLSHLDRINHPREWDDFRFRLDFLEDHHFQHGLEINLSRGCRRGCIFCAKVQGRNLRPLPQRQLAELLGDWKNRLCELSIESPAALTVNINDDDILQDLDYARQTFQIIEKHGFRLWGIQTSINSLFTAESTLRSEALELADDDDLFVNGKKLLWLGTDTFLEARGKKLAKRIPPQEAILRLADELEKRGILHYHYWISSDQQSDWQEFIEEFSFIVQLKQQFPSFHLLAHAPFLVPYISTPLYKKLVRDPNEEALIVYRSVLKGAEPAFDFPLALRVETPWQNLNRLLKNEGPDNRYGFFDHIKSGDFTSALMTAYHFLKQERFQTESVLPSAADPPLKTLQHTLEDLIASLM